MYRLLGKFASFALMATVSAYAAPGDVEFIVDHKISESEADQINYVSLEKSGETILCGHGGGGAWVSVLAPSGQSKYTAVVAGIRDGASEACWTVLTHEPSKTLIAGETNTHSLLGKEWGQESLPPPRRYETTPHAALIATLRPDGSTADKLVFGNFKKYYRNTFYRGVRVADGYVLAGMLTNEWPAFTRSGTIGVAALWVVKIDFAGALKWQYQLAEDGGDVLEVNRHHYFSQLFELPDGSLVLAVSMGRLAHRQQAGQRRLLGIDVKPQNPGGVLMVRLAPDGKELRRVWGGPDIFLALRGNEIVSLGNPPRSDPSAIVVDRLETVTFDYDLNRKSSRILEIGPQYFSIEGIAVAASGELFAIGTYASRRGHREIALVQITAKELRVLKHFRSGQWGGITRARDSDDFVVARLSTLPLGSPDMKRDIELMKFKISR